MNPPDLRERGTKNGQPIFLDRRLFMQFLAFGNCSIVEPLILALNEAEVEGALYADANDAQGVGLLACSENPDFFVTQLREILNQTPFTNLTPKPEYTMFGRTYAIGYEPDLETALLTKPRQKIVDPAKPWAIWYPLRREKGFEQLPEEEKKKMLGEHGGIGMAFGRAGYATDIRLACHGLDKNDNDFVVGILGAELHPISSVVQAMRKTRQTAEFLESLGPFFVGKAIWQSKG